MLVTQRAVEDDGIIDLFLTSADVRTRRIASPRDDGEPQFSPDGRLVAFSTARWDTLYHYDLALLSVEDSVPEQLTSGPASDGAPRWSPDGSAITFARHNWGESRNEICVVRISDRSVTCRAGAAQGDEFPVGWIDRDRVLVSLNQGNTTRLIVLQWSTGERVTAYEGQLGDHVTLSDDGEWVACECVTAPGQAPRFAVFPLSAPALMRPIGVPRSTRLVAHTWLASSATRLAARVRIEPVTRLHADVAARLTARVFDSRLVPLRLHGAVRWSATPSGSATIDSLTGDIVVSGRSASIVVRATAGAGVQDSLVIQVDTAEARAHFTERWASLGNWVPFGAPVPSVGRHADGTPAFFTNGDGSFFSGAYSQETVVAAGGASVEVRVSSPINRPQWQAIRIRLVRTELVRSRRGFAGRNAPPSTSPGANCACSRTRPRDARPGCGPS